MTASSALDAKVARKQARAATDPNGATGRLPPGSPIPR